MAKNEQKKKKKEMKPEHIDPAVIKQIAKNLKSYSSIMEKDEVQRVKDKFMQLYQRCEYAYKQILIDYKVKHEGLVADVNYKPKRQVKSNKFNPDNLKIVKEQYQKVLVYGGISFDEMLFSLEDDYLKDGNKSCRRLRNEITHNGSKKAVKEVFDRKEELYGLMRSFLAHFNCD